MYTLGINKNMRMTVALKLVHKHKDKTLKSDPKYKGINAIQITNVVYIVKPINFASLKFSGRFRVRTA